MLFALLDRFNAEVSAIDVSEEAPALLEQVRLARPDFVKEVDRARKRSGGTKEAMNLALLGLAAAVLGMIKEMPQIVDAMVQKIRKRRADPHLRCALAGTLAYVVQPHDLIPDDAPGSYGLLDDCLLLRVGLREYLNLIPANATEAEKQGQHIQLFANLVPLNVLPAFQLAIQGMAITFQTLRLLPPEMAHLAAEQIIANPLQMTAPAPPPGFSPSLPPSLGGGHWGAGGAYFEGNNVMIPGGPSLIDGQLFVP